MIPCVYALLSGKSEVVYKHLLSELKEAALKIKLKLEPKEVLTDFERAAMNAYTYHYPEVKIRSCYFHFGQNIFRKIVDIGLKQQYQNDKELKKWVNMIIASLILPNLVSDQFVLLIEKCRRL